MKLNSDSDRYKRLINLNKALDTILVLSDLWRNLIRNLCKYFEARIRRRLSFLVDVVFILL